MLEDNINLQAIFCLLQRQLRIIIASIVTVVTLTLIYLFSIPPEYSASAMLQISPASKNILLGETNNQNFSINNVLVDGEVEILGSTSVALRVVDAANLLQDSEFGLSSGQSTPNPQTLLTQTIRNFQYASTITRKGQTYLLAAQVTSQDPAKAARLANIWVESYLNHQVSLKVGALREINITLTKQLSEAQGTLAISNQLIDAYIVENINEIARYSTQEDLLNLASQRQNIVLELQQQQTLYEIVKTEFEAENWAAIAARMQDDALKVLSVQNTDINNLLADGAAGADVHILQARLAEINTDLADRSYASLASQNDRVSQLTAQETMMSTEIRTLVLEGELPPRMIASIYGLQQEADIALTEYNALLVKSREMSLQEALQIPDSRMISPALPPLLRSNNNQIEVMLLATIAAIVLGLALAVTNEFWTGGITSPEQFYSLADLRVTTAIPVISKGKSDENINTDIAQKFLDAPMSHYAESIRSLRVSVDQALSHHPSIEPLGKIVMVSSSIQGEGKSNTSLALARAYALSGQSTLLVDCDFRKPKIHAILQPGATNDLFEFIATNPNGSSDQDFNLFQDITGMNALIGTAEASGLTDRALTHPAFTDFLSSVRSEFDIIILDTPPLLPVIDSVHLAEKADVIVLIVKWASTSQKNVRIALKKLKDAKHPHTDVVAVLNQENAGNIANIKSGTSYYQN